MDGLRGVNGGKEGFGNEGSWAAFHQAYDSALRAWRRGPDVSRAVNWLFVASRDEASEDEREMERENREAGLKLGMAAKSEVEIAPLVWQAASDGVLVTAPGFRAAKRDLATSGEGGSTGGSSGASGSAPSGGAGGAAGGGATGGAGAGSGSNAPAPGEVGPPSPTDPSTWADPATGAPEVVYPDGGLPPSSGEGEKPNPGRGGSTFEWEYLL